MFGTVGLRGWTQRRCGRPLMTSSKAALHLSFRHLCNSMILQRPCFDPLEAGWMVVSQLFPTLLVLRQIGFWDSKKPLETLNKKRSASARSAVAKEGTWWGNASYWRVSTFYPSSLARELETWICEERVWKREIDFTCSQQSWIHKANLIRPVCGLLRCIFTTSNLYRCAIRLLSPTYAKLSSNPN